MHDLVMITAMNADPSAFPPSENRGIPTRKKWTKREEGGLTGYRRYRPDQRAPGPIQMVLEVEYTEFTSVEEGKPGRWVCMWRDATPADLREINVKGYYV
jgi:hypothetical protein